MAAETADFSPQTPSRDQGKQCNTAQGRVGIPKPTHSRTASSFDLSPVYVDARYWSFDVWQPKTDLLRFLSRDLDVSRLNAIYSLLWWAGRQVPPRPLHRWKMLGFKIGITEQADLHLIWSAETLFVKPLPPYLLDYSFWCIFICDERPNQDIYETACGFLFSYVWLIRYSSDFDIAKHEHLLPENVTWTDWKEIVNSIWDHSGDISCVKSIDKRYTYGSLRLSRLDQIYRFAPQFRLKYLMGGYLQSYSSFGGFVKREFAWLIVAFAYVSIILTALQVGLATTQLRDSEVFNMVAYGFTTAAIMLPAVILGFTITLYIWVWTYNLSITIYSWSRDPKNKAQG